MAGSQEDPARSKVERQSDAARSTRRAAADESKSKSRHEVDGSLERPGSGDHLRQERQASDHALAGERQDMDFAIWLERAQSRSVLSEERDAHVVTRAAVTTRDEFLAIVSHDLRNPLGSISMAAEMLTGSPFYGTADSESRQYVEIIKRNADEALQLIGDLLDMERLAAGKLGFHVASYDVGAILTHCFESFLPQAAARQVTLRIATSDEPMSTVCDRGRITQLLANLLGNALKFTPARGEIALTVDSTDSEIHLAVADTGPGIPLQMHETIFERLWQIRQSDRRGLGLGLYIAKLIAEAHQGRIWVESVVGQGSKFHVALPRIGQTLEA